MSQAPAKATLLFEAVSPSLLIAMYGEHTPNEIDWAKYIEAIAQMGDEVRVLAFSSGGGPALLQRRQLEETLGNRGGRAAIVTTSRVARGIVQAIRWFNRDIKAYAPAEWSQALEFMGIEGAEAKYVMDRLKVMARQMGNFQDFGMS